MMRVLHIPTLCHGKIESRQSLGTATVGKRIFILYIFNEHSHYVSVVPFKFFIDLLNSKAIATNAPLTITYIQLLN